MPKLLHNLLQVFGQSISQGPGIRRSIALTFDDGPSEATLRLLEYLAQQSVQATFFQCGMNILRHPAIAQAVNQAGHEIGNHTFSHPRLCPWPGQRPLLKSAAFIYDQFSRTQDVIAAQIGLRAKLMRVPYGLSWLGVGAAQRKLGLLGVMWTVIGRDWVLNADQIAGLVLQKAAPGGIICLHDGRDIQAAPNVTPMLDAVRQIVPMLKDRGYRFETVSELLRP
jgi:peptidoglycan/xylan/chitin deacetylase (PgdA/CDA1 family)